MKKLLLSLGLLLAASQAWSQQSVSYFPGTYEEFQSLMVERNKPAIVLFYSHRHGKSKLFLESMNDDSALVSFVDSHFVAYRVNTNDDYDLPMSFRITDIPSLIILDRNFKEVNRMEGREDHEGLLDMLKKAK